ncbi:MAG: YqcI/YcgG family protein [Caulobacter sp.]|nr:YqcI/YcgG family protein [Caulobacter sp.]
MTDSALAERFRAFIRERNFPCVGAKSALAHDRIEVVQARDIRSAWDDLDIHAALSRFAARYRRDPQPFQSLAVIFAGPEEIDEVAFEQALWARLQSLTDKDVFNGYPADARISPDVANPHFAMSFAGEGFFVVGLHPGASRPARRFEAPALVFNPHDQFESLRADGRYETLRDKILARDKALAGSINPMLARHGDASAARQYSGRQVPPTWRPPFTSRPANDA